MPKQRRQPSSPTTPAAEGAGIAIDPDVARFAAAMKETARRETEVKQKAADARKAAEAEAAEVARVQDLVRAKDEAAERLREARRSGRGVTEAEVAYKAALAAVVAAETGARPTWAPPELEAAGEVAPSDSGPGPAGDADAEALSTAPEAAEEPG